MAFNQRTWDSDTRIGIISSATESKRIVCNLPFENQLFGYIHYCSEVPEINVNLLPIHAIFNVSFGSFFHYISLRMRKMCILEKLNLKNSRGSMPPDPPTVLVPKALHTIFAGLTLNCFRLACYYQWVKLSIILRILRRQKMFLFSIEKGVPSVLYRDIYYC